MAKSVIRLLTSLGAIVEPPSPRNGNPFLCILVQFSGKLEHVQFPSLAKAQEVCSDTCSHFGDLVTFFFPLTSSMQSEPFEHSIARFGSRSKEAPSAALEGWMIVSPWVMERCIHTLRKITNKLLCRSHLVLHNGDAWDNSLEDQCCSFSSPTAHALNYPRKSLSVILGL